MGQKEESEERLVDFCESWFDFWPYNYQKKFLFACINERRVAGLWSRQSGKSTTLAAYLLYMALNFHLFLDKKEFKILCFAPTQRQSSELFLKIKLFAESSPLIRLALESSTQTEIKFKNGALIKSLPTGELRGGLTIRGLTADILVLEEAGYIKNSIVNEVLLPMIGSSTSYGQIIKIGTPKGKGHFYDSCYGKETKYALIATPWEIVLEEGQYTKEFIEEAKASLTDLEFNTEYGIKFIEDADSYFAQALIDECVTEYPMINQGEIY